MSLWASQRLHGCLPSREPLHSICLLVEEFLGMVNAVADPNRLFALTLEYTRMTQNNEASFFAENDEDCTVHIVVQGAVHAILEKLPYLHEKYPVGSAWYEKQKAASDEGEWTEFVEFTKNWLPPLRDTTIVFE
jgi:hypothetical protein